ncbi:hypothetical protein Q8F55_008196 [Vanrija albida]|uniref:Uncharacterized protein n=1 Tax=Vanrija albida TaxID=181172 RepID=A0ABR3PWI1_9TREE
MSASSSTSSLTRALFPPPLTPERASPGAPSRATPVPHTSSDLVRHLRAHAGPPVSVYTVSLIRAYVDYKVSRGKLPFEVEARLEDAEEEGEFHAAFATVRYLRGLRRSDAVEMEWPPRVDWGDPVIAAATEATDLEGQRESACVRATGTDWYAQRSDGGVRHRHVEVAFGPTAPPTIPSMGAGRHRKASITSGLGTSDDR